MKTSRAARQRGGFGRRGDLHVGEVSWTNSPQTCPDQPRPANPALTAQVPPAELNEKSLPAERVEVTPPLPLRGRRRFAQPTG